jgi:hypothetical protein
MVKVFEKPLHPGWVYPCTVEEIEQQLLTFPPTHLEGLAVICLVPSIRKEPGRYGCYYPGDKPTICLYSWPDSLTFKGSQRVKRRHIEHKLVVERSFGMQVEQIGSRWFCRWNREDWRHFILEHVLPHEIGHHVGEYCDPSEQFAEDYALRYQRSRQLWELKR